MRTLSILALCFAILAGPARAATPARTARPTIEERHAAYAAKTAAIGTRLTKRQRRMDRLKVLGARLLIRSGLSGPFERRANARSLAEQIDSIITAGELRVERLHMPVDQVRADVQRQVDGLRDRSYVVPDNRLGVR